MITVLMTTYNCANWIKASVKSILNQTYEDYEFLIIDDGSEDRTKEIIATFHDERIRYIQLQHQGRSSALNYGLREASSDIIALMDADDIAHPNRIESELSLYPKFNEIIFSDSVYFKKDKVHFLNNVKKGENLIEKIQLHGHICNSSVIYNRKFILENGGYNETLPNSEDYELWLRLLDKAKFIHITEYLIFVRVRDESLGRQNHELTRKIISSLKANLVVNSHSINHKLKGWDSFFYGNPTEVRKYLKLNSLRNIMVNILSYAPESLISIITVNKWVPRIKYLYFMVRFPELHRSFRNFLTKNC